MNLSGKWLSLASIGTATLVSRNIIHSQENTKPATSNAFSIDDIPSRKEMLSALKNNSFDVLIIGAGATGAGCALDAATRGLKVALIERDDFSSGTSSRSTKLVHGGVRYLEKAFLNFDIDQYKLVREALHERGIFLKIAPHLTYELPTMLPIYQLWKVPYYYFGSKAYDIIAGSKGLSHSYFLFPSKAIQAFPNIKNKNLYGAMVYYDGAQNDSRMNVALAMTSVLFGAIVANHVEVVQLNKKKGQDGIEKLCGATVKDMLTSEEWEVKAKGIINATGPFTDSIRKMDDHKTENIVQPSSGVHLILPDYFCPSNIGLIDPSTSDGRVIFVLPWLGSTIAGTTDAPSELSFTPQSTKEEIDWILREMRNLMCDDVKVRKKDILAAWTGIRPLVRDPAALDTAELVRNHMINVSPSGLLTIAGGKWTTYRCMAEETIDRAIKEFNLQPVSKCQTENTLVLGAHNWNKFSFIHLIQKYNLDSNVARHLSNSYGDQAYKVVELFPQHTLLSKNHPYIEAEVLYACRNELACTAVDVLARRTRLAFLHAKDALEVLPRVITLMGDELGWDSKRREKEYLDSYSFLQTMGLDIMDE